MDQESPDERGTAVRTWLRTFDAGAARISAAEILPAIYDELRDLARARMARESPGATIQATALVHEAYLRLVGDEDPGWNGRGHFFASAAQAMRQVLVDRARARASHKRGGPFVRVEFDESALVTNGPEVDVLALDEALTRLEERDPRKSQVVKLKYFAGLEMEEIAAALDLSLSSVKNDWMFARAWLHRELERA